MLGVGPLKEGALLGRPRWWGKTKEGHTGMGRFFQGEIGTGTRGIWLEGRPGGRSDGGGPPMLA